MSRAHEISDGLAHYLIGGAAGRGYQLTPLHAIESIKRAIDRDRHERERLLQWARSAGAGTVGDDDRVLDTLLRDVEVGWLRVFKVPPRRIGGFASSVTRPATDHAPAPSEAVPFEEPTRALRITSCDAELSRGEAPLTYSYLLRGLSAGPVALRITNDNYPGGIVHEEQLDPDACQDGGHNGRWSGEVSEGPDAGRRLSPRHGPCKLELVHDEQVCDAAGFEVACHRRRVIDIEDLLFHNDSAVLMPDYRDCTGDPFHPDAESTTGLRALAVCLRQQSTFPEQSLLITGHTDTKGSAKHNLELSRLRAEGVCHALLGDAQAWAQVADARNTVEDWQQILGWIHLSLGWDCDPGRPDGIAGPRTRGALHRFVKRWATDGRGELPKADAPTQPHWEAFFELFDERLADILECDAAGLQAMRDELRFVDDARRAVGCGEHRPRVETQDGVRSATNRRVELLFFDPGEEPPLLCHDGEECIAELCELDIPSIYEPEYIPCNIRTPVEVFVHPEEVGTRVGFFGKLFGKHYVVGTLGPPRETVYPWYVGIGPDQPPTPLKLLFRRRGQELDLCWRGEQPDLYFLKNGWLPWPLAVVDGPEAEPTVELVDGQLIISGVQQGDVIIAEEQKTPGKLKGRAKVYVVKNFTWNDLQRIGGKLSFWGPFDHAPDDFKRAMQEAIFYMLDNRPGRPQEKHRKDLEARIYSPTLDSQDTGQGNWKGVPVDGDHQVHGLCRASVPSTLAIGVLPRDTYHLHIGGITLSRDDFDNLERPHKSKLKKILDELHSQTHFGGPTTGLHGISEAGANAQAEYVRRSAEPTVDFLSKVWPKSTGSPVGRLLLHSYESVPLRYITPSNPKTLYGGDPIRNVEIALPLPPNLHEPFGSHLTAENYGQDPNYHNVVHLYFCVNHRGELFFYPIPPSTTGFGLRTGDINGGWLPLMDALGELDP